MKINLITLGGKMPAWIETGYQEYAKRFPKECRVHLIEISSRKSETEIFTKIRPTSTMIALDERGELWDTLKLAKHLQQWQLSGKDIALLIGGADGLSKNILKKVHFKWSLSPLTFPHMLVRVMVAEQLYRAFTVLSGHPYHRA